MSQAGAILLWLLIFIAVYVLTRRINLGRARRASYSIIRELESKRAYDPASAVPIKDAKRNMLRAGLRNFRPEGMQVLLANDVIGVTGDGKYYLKGSQSDARADTRALTDQ